MRPWQALLEVKWFTEANIALTSHLGPDLTILVFHQLWLKYRPAEHTWASCSELPFHSTLRTTLSSQPVFVPESAASINTHTPLMNSEEAFLSVLWKGAIKESQHSGQFYGSPLRVPAKYLTANNTWTGETAHKSLCCWTAGLN